MEIICKVINRHLVPASECDVQLIESIPNGAEVKCRVTRPRNLAFHRKFFALLKLTYDNLPYEVQHRLHVYSEGDMLRRFKRDLGYFTNTINEYGEREIEYLSISFSQMEQGDFELFYRDCVNIVKNKYLQGVGEQDLNEEIERSM